MRLLSIFFFLAITSMVQAQWTDADNFPPQSTSFQTIFPVNQNLVYATTIDKILKTTDGGDSWTEMYSGSGDFFEDIYFKNANEGFVVGWRLTGQYVILRTTDGGQNWSEFIPSFPLITAAGFQGIDFSSDNVGYVVGANGKYVKTIDGGATWTEKSIFAGSATFVDVEFTDDNTGFILSDQRNYFFTTTDGGENWTRRSGPFSEFRGDIQFFDAQNGYAYGGSFLAFTTNGGLTWRTGDEMPPRPYAYYFTDEMTGYVAGIDGDIYKTVDRGATWLLQEISGLVAPSQMRFSDANNGWIAGGDFGKGSVFKTQNAGGIAVDWELPINASCPGDTIIFDCNHLDGQTFNWFLDGSPIGSGLPYYFVANESGAYEISLEVSNGSHAKTFNQNLPISGTNVPVLFAEAADTVCINEPATFRFLSENNPFRLSVKSDGQTLLNQQSVGLSDTVEWISPPVTGTQTFDFFKDEFGCDPYLLFSKTIRVIQPPATDLAVDFLQNPVCENGFAEVKISNPESTIFYQILIDGEVQNLPTRPGSSTDFVLSTKQVQDIGQVEVKATASKVCHRILDEKLDLEIMFVDPIFSPLTINVSQNDVLSLSNYSGDSLTVDWDFGANATPAQSSRFDPSLVRYSTTGDKEIRLIGVSPRGCRDTAFQKINIYDSSILPDEWALSQNSNMFNDDFGLLAVDVDLFTYTTSKGSSEQFDIRTTAGVEINLNFGGELLQKHDALGVLQWAVPFKIEGTTDPRERSEITISDITTIGNDVYVTGMVNNNFTGKAVFASTSGETVEVVENHFVFLLKYDASGKLVFLNKITPLYENNCNGINESVQAVSVRANESGDIFLACRKNPYNNCRGWSYYDAAGNSTRIVQQERETFFKINSDGSLVWSKPYSFFTQLPDGGQSIEIACLESDANGGLAILGQGIPTSNSNDPKSRVAHISKFDSDGNFQWEYVVKGDRATRTGYIFGKDLTIDDEGSVFALLSINGVAQFIPSRAGTVYERTWVKVSASGEFKFVRHLQHQRPNVNASWTLGMDYDDGLIYIKTRGCIDDFYALPICIERFSADEKLFITVWDTLGHLLQVLPYKNNVCNGNEQTGAVRSMVVRDANVFSVGRIAGGGSSEIGGLMLEDGQRNYVARFREPQEFLPYITLPYINFTGCSFTRCDNDGERKISVSPIFEDLKWYRDGNPTTLTDWEILPSNSGLYHAEGINPLGQTVESPQRLPVTVTAAPVVAPQATATQIVVNLVPDAYYYYFDSTGFQVDWGLEKNIFEPMADGVYTVRIFGNGCTSEAQITFPGNSNLIDMDMDGFFSDSDCDDMNPDINPGAVEIPNNDIDEDCDGIAQIIDEDMDGFNSDEDCDDFNPEANPAADEIPNNDVDEDCDGEILVIDEDMDGFNSDEDCDDVDPDVNPDATEIPNNDVDEDCDGIAQIIDNDNDGFNSDEDCDDTNPNINPDALEIPDNGIDEDCDGMDATSSARDLVFKNSIKVFPNPVLNILKIELAQPTFVEISIFDALGGKVLEIFPQERRRKFEVDLAGKSSGIYILKVQNLQEGSIGQFRMVKGQF